MDACVECVSIWVVYVCEDYPLVQTGLLEPSITESSKRSKRSFKESLGGRL